MKIISGQFKGRNFYMPGDIRPTQNIVRKSFFDTMADEIEGCQFIDLFAGSGAVGIEALSRGAKKVVFVEKESQFADLIRENLGLVGFNPLTNKGQQVELLCQDAFVTTKTFASKAVSFDIVFADPPYGRALAKKILKTINLYDIVRPTCKVIIQHDKHEILPEREGRFLVFRKKKYGSSWLSYYEINRENLSQGPTA
jgi:16S rRNA (guanine966-N2)-methyltransferase